jgi:hypothetical protein
MENLREGKISGQQWLAKNSHMFSMESQVDLMTVLITIQYYGQERLPNQWVVILIWLICG